MTMKDMFNEMMAPSGAEVSIIPVVQGEGVMKIDEAQLPDSLPILALRNAVLFPGTVYPITIGREKSIRLIEDAERSNTFIGAVPQNDFSVEDPRKEDLYPYGTVAKIIKTLEMPDGTITAILQGFKRFEIEEIFDYEPYMLGRVRYQDDVVPENDTKTRMIAESLKEKASQIIRSSAFVPREAASALKGIDSFEFLVNFIATTVEVENFMDKVDLLQYGDLKTRDEAPFGIGHSGGAPEDQAGDQPEGQDRDRPAAEGILPEQPAQDHPGGAGNGRCGGVRSAPCQG